MSELNNSTPEELVEEINRVVEDAEVIPPPIDTTLSIPGAAADAYATGQAIEGVLNGLKINGQDVVNKAVTLLASHIKMSNEQDAQTIAEAIQALADRNADDILYDSEELITVADAITGLDEGLDEGFTDEEIEAMIEEGLSEEDEEA